jgi:hypothetical protein
VAAGAWGVLEEGRCGEFDEATAEVLLNDGRSPLVFGFLAGGSCDLFAAVREGEGAGESLFPVSLPYLWTRRR